MIMSLLYLRAVGAYHQMVKPVCNNATIKQKQLVEKNSMLGMLMNPYEPFDIKIDEDYKGFGGIIDGHRD